MRLILFILLILFTTLCVGIKQRGPRRFSPRSRLRVDVDEKSDVGVKEIEVPTPAPTPSRSRQRSSLRPRPFSARFSGRNTPKNNEIKEAEPSTSEPSTPKPVKRGPRGRRPHIHRILKTTTVKSSTTVAAIEEILAKEDMTKEDILSTKDMPEKEIAKEPTKISRPISPPKIRSRPLPIRLSRRGSRNRSQMKTTKTEETLQKSDDTIDKHLEKKVESPSLGVEPDRGGNNHRFSAGSGLRGRRPRLPRIKGRGSQKSETPTIKQESEIKVTIEEDVGTMSSMQKEEPAVVEVKTRNISPHTLQKGTDKMVEGSIKIQNETQQRVFIIKSLVLDEDTFIDLDISTNQPTKEIDINSTILEGEMNTNTLEMLRDATSIEIATNKTNLEQAVNQTIVESTTNQTYLDITKSQISPKVTTYKTISKTISYQDSIHITTESDSLDDSTKVIPTENESKIVTLNINTERIPLSITTKIVSSEIQKHSSSLEITTKRTTTEIPIKIASSTIPTENILADTPKQVPLHNTFKDSYTETIPTVNYDYDDEYDYSNLEAFKDYPHYYAEGETIQNTSIDSVSEHQLSAMPRIRNSPSRYNLQNIVHQTRHTEAIRYNGLIGTVENTPDKQVQEILSGMGSRRRGLSRT